MKGCLSLLLALLVLAVLLAGGYWLYNKTQDGGRLGSSGSAGPSLTIQNQTSFALTVLLTKPGRVERFMLPPGETERKPIQEGTYSVEGQISDPDTSSFTGEWTFDRAMNYNAVFTRSGEGGGLSVVRPVPQ